MRVRVRILILTLTRTLTLTLTLTLTQSVVADRFSLARTVMPPVVQYPVQDVGYPFFKAILGLFYGHSLSSKAAALRDLLTCLVLPARAKPKPTTNPQQI